MTLLDSALYLAAQGFWIFPIVAGKKAPPAVSQWQDAAMQDRAVIMSWWKNNPDDNIGISTSKFKGYSALLVVDIDMKNEKDGEASIIALELKGFDLPDTFTQITPTGGRHLVYMVPTAVKQGTNILGPGLDIRSKGGYIVGSGSMIGEKYYTHEEKEIVTAPQWLIDRCGKVKESKIIKEPLVLPSESALKRAWFYLENEAPLAIEGHGGDETAYKVAAKVKDMGVMAFDAFTLLKEVWNPRCQPPWSGEELQQKVLNVFSYGNLPPGIASPEADFKESPPSLNGNGKGSPFMQLNREFAFVLAGGGAHILWETTDAEDRYRLEHLAIGAFHAKFAPQKIMNGKKEAPISQLWMEWKGRREYDGFIFMPEQDPPKRFYNLWKGFAYKPASEFETHYSLDMFLEHVNQNICQEDEKLFTWIMGFFAHLIQKPFEKPLVSLVFRGGKGVGKNAPINIVGNLLGHHFLSVSNRRYLVGNFNGHFENCLLFVLDEAFWSGDKQAEGTLKDLITGQYHVIEHKGKEPYIVANKTRVVIIGNEEWMVPATYDERRFAVFDVGTGRKQDRPFFIKMKEGMEKGGYPVLLRYLLDYDLENIDLGKIPMTVGLLDQKHQSMEPFQQWWFDCLDHGVLIGGEFKAWPETIECDGFRAAFKRYAQERQIKSRLPNDRSIGWVLRDASPSLKRKRLAKRDTGEQPYGYQFPSLELARSEWSKYIGHSIKWEN